MKIGMIGLPQTGKKALFELLTGHKPSENEVASGKPIHGVAEIRDSRFDALVAMYKPKKEVRARIELELLPKIEKDAISKGDIFTDIAEVDALCHVVRAFKDDSENQGANRLVSYKFNLSTNNNATNKTLFISFPSSF